MTSLQLLRWGLLSSGSPRSSGKVTGGAGMGEGSGPHDAGQP